MTPFFQGFAMGGGLIVAIGAQNAFVLTQGVRRNHHLAVAGVCIVCDGLLIGLGVSGVGALVAASPSLGAAAAWAGAAFLAWYGLGALRAAIRGNTLAADTESGMSLERTLALTLAVTLLNPHVYLDTVVLMGSLSGRFEGLGRYVFGLGAVAASTVWFMALSLGGGLLAPLFRRPVTWRVLDSLVCLTMWTIAASLIRSTLA
ncbi:MAG: LysE/ArgO family amino acid transporter [Pseudodesulfovibrio sp.]|uniref:Lysine exporter protein (LYSE/YGGA) n=1 Tax=Pseudodesulfovibrio aespoeensis (strain ATCC 700646 / DSM 10631 / Aspo-2) TaxID=643562 RepID=E6VTZ1_PSEA9|nr:MULTISPECIES: LysE/ArgO family amino acid transporter [Pseudodesulfovibrio]MBU4192772.1 LysE/ArgO family amino acid transporter [Pseudomonadota bacterium]ADU61083.1 Lysine exporter protein (LYSE/YGGA) [Pseudodesulfovibrio aespoeensis Aspo-2]MBU4244102.1 LysE/ArgO family amino acid transporter [Pseudomonadota bacterium]MBU4379311.1 LysE/ArgO family amino acid transporter [Pseudomonadota bacterium]MBU4476463.1 LysE/ArgO family amino acid transporter [Pseudomonadota bacterium]